MNIRCERCSTVYELDEALLAPEGSSVQCTRCQHVFTARPPSAPGQTLVGLPAQPAPEDPPAAAVEAARPAPAPAPPARDLPAPTQPAQATRVPVPARGVPPPVYRPTPGPGAVRAAPVLRKDAVGTFESRLRWHARLRWLVPVAVAGVLLVAAVAWYLLARRAAPDPARAVAPAAAATRSEPRPAPAPAPTVPAVAPGSTADDGATSQKNAAAVPVGTVAPPRAAPAPQGSLRPEGIAPPPSTASAPVPEAAPAPEAAAPAPVAPRFRAGVLPPAVIPEPGAASALPQVEPPEIIRRSMPESGATAAPPDADDPYVPEGG